MKKSETAIALVLPFGFGTHSAVEEHHRDIELVGNLLQPARRDGVPLNLVQRWLGHASMATTAIYLDALGEEEREIAARMWATAPAPAPSPGWIDRA